LTNSRQMPDIALMAPGLRKYYAFVGLDIDPLKAFGETPTTHITCGLKAPPTAAGRILRKQSIPCICAQYVSDPVTFLNVAKTCRAAYSILMRETVMHQFLEYRTVSPGLIYPKASLMLLVLEWNSDPGVYNACMRTSREAWALLNLTTIWSKNIYFYMNPNHCMAKLALSQERYEKHLTSSTYEIFFHGRTTEKMICKALYVTKLHIPPQIYISSGVLDSDGTMDHFGKSIKKQIVPNLTEACFIECYGTPLIHFLCSTTFVHCALPTNNALRFRDHYFEYSSNELHPDSVSDSMFGSKSAWLKLPNAKERLATIAKIQANAHNKRLVKDNVSLATIAIERLEDLCAFPEIQEELLRGRMILRKTDDGKAVTVHIVDDPQKSVRAKNKICFHYSHHKHFCSTSRSKNSYS